MQEGTEDERMKKKKKTKPDSSRAGKREPRKTKSNTSVAARIPVPTSEQVDQAKRKYAKGIVARGEAVPEGVALPPGATHEIVGREEDDTPILRRKRFSLR